MAIICRHTKSVRSIPVNRQMATPQTNYSDLGVKTRMSDLSKKLAKWAINGTNQDFYKDPISVHLDEQANILATDLKKSQFCPTPCQYDSLRY